MAKTAYTVTINHLPTDGAALEYKYRNTRCTLTASSGAASVSFQMGVKKTFEDLVTFRVDLVKDALRKMYLFHAIRFDSALEAGTITVTIGEESRIYDASCPGFPFLRSMLTGTDLGLPDSWREESFLQTVLTLPKSKTDNDPRFACLFSFLAGTGKSYEIDRFTCYWTAMNSFYCHLMEQFKQEYARRNGFARYEDLPKKKRINTGDSGCLSALMCILNCGSTISSQNDRISCRTQYGALKGHLSALPREELPALCRQLREHRSDFGWTPAGPLGDHLLGCMRRTDMTAWSFIALDYAYYMRCKYLHGSKTTTLFSTVSDPEVAAFETLNQLLGDFLKEFILLIFREGWFTEQMYRAIERGVR